MPSERIFTKDQENAITAHGRDLLVSAAAGSGKTAVLTERVIRELTGETPDGHRIGIDRMLIATFTVAAAGELRSRIADALNRRIARTPDDPDLIRQILLLSRAHISTIDALFLDIVRTHFEKLGLSSSFRLGDEADLSAMEERAMRQAVDTLYARYAPEGADPADPFGKVEQNPFSLFLDSMLSGREDTDLFSALIGYRHYFSDDPDDLKLLKDCSDRLRRELENYTFFGTTDGDVFRKRMTETFGHFRSEYERYLTRFDEPGSEHLRTAYGPAFQTDLRHICGFLDLLSKDDTGFDALAAFLEGITFGELKRRSSSDPDYVFAAKDARDLYVDTVRDLQKVCEGITDAQIQKDLATVIGHCDFIRELYEEYDARLNADKNAGSVYSFSDITRFALNLLQDEHGNPSEIAQQLRSGFDALYIDEYQDVSPIQDRIFRLIGEGHRFMVGDIKQSIYQFRGAEPSLFNTYRNRMTPYGSPEDNGTDPACLFLSDNFRSDPPVLNTSNRICGTLFRVADGTVTYASGDDLRTPETRADAPSVPVRMCVVPRGERTAPGRLEDEFLVRTVKDLLKTHAPQDILLLLQTNNQIDGVRKLLNAAGLPVNPAQASLSQDRHMRDLINLLSVIDNPHDDDSLFEALQLPPFDMTKADLMTVRSREELRFSLWDSVKSHPDRSAAAADPLVLRCQFAVRLINELRELCAVQSADQVLQTICRHSDFKALARSRAMTFVRDLAHRLQTAGFCPLHTFLPYLTKTLAARKTASELSDSYINILTVHKSKGLQAKVVIIPKLDSLLIPNTPETVRLFFDRLQGPALPIRDPESLAERKSFHEWIVRARYEDALKEEKIRLLYVAMTRAEQELILIGKASKPAEATDPGRQTALDRFLLFDASSYLDWVLPALLHPHAAAGSAPAGSFTVETPEVGESEDEPSAAPAVPTTQTVPEEPESELARKNRAILEAYRKKADESDLTVLGGIPTSVAASKISPDFLDTLREEETGDLTGQDESPMSQGNLEKRLELLSSPDRTFSQLLDESRRITAAEKGTLTHMFMQFVDFQKLKDTSVEQQILELTDNGFISKRQADRMHLPFLKKFAGSDLLSDLLRGRDVYREYEFALKADLSAFTKDPEYAKRLAALPDPSIQIRGSIDLLYTDESGKLCLIDYKTDAIPSDIRDESAIRAYLLDKHRTQLQIYAQAVSRIFGRRPDFVGIFSFVTGRVYDLGRDLDDFQS